MQSKLEFRACLEPSIGLGVLSRVQNQSHRDQRHMPIPDNLREVELLCLPGDVHDLSFVVGQVHVVDLNQVPQVVIWPEQLCSPASQAFVDVCIRQQPARPLPTPAAAQSGSHRQSQESKFLFCVQAANAGSMCASQLFLLGLQAQTGTSVRMREAFVMHGHLGHGFEKRDAEHGMGHACPTLCLMTKLT